MKTVTMVCDCGKQHQVPATFVGTHNDWQCLACSDREHEEFVTSRTQVVVR